MFLGRCLILEGWDWSTKNSQVWVKVLEGWDWSTKNSQVWVKVISNLLSCLRCRDPGLATSKSIAGKPWHRPAPHTHPLANFQISLQQMPSKWPAHGHWLVSYGKGLDLWMKGNLEAAFSSQLHNMSRILTNLFFSTQIKLSIIHVGLSPTPQTCYSVRDFSVPALLIESCL